jgi:Mn2+/Fe2+ NRAMP family transporter
MENQQKPQLQEQSHTIFIVSDKTKSVGIAIALAVLFGPAGLLYASIAGGIIMFVLAIISFVLLPLIALFLVWVGCIIWAVTAAQCSNQRTVARVINHRETGNQPEL